MQSKEYFETANRSQTYLGRVILLTLLLMFGAVLQTAACGHKMRISRNDSGKEITVSRGNLIELSLESQGATGYLWKFERIDPEYVDFVREETTSKSVPGRTGGPVIHIWTLLVKKEGLTEIRMSYYRPWEGKSTAVDTFMVRLRILP